MMNESELYEKHPVAYEALPVPYQNDSCLDFWVEENPKSPYYGVIFCQPRKDQESTLGVWTCAFVNQDWVQSAGGNIPIKRG